MRRDFIKVVGALQLSGRSRRAQQADQVWRIGVLMQLVRAILNPRRGQRVAEELG